MFWAGRVKIYLFFAAIVLTAGLLAGAILSYRKNQPSIPPSSKTEQVQGEIEIINPAATPPASPNLPETKAVLPVDQPAGDSPLLVSPPPVPTRQVKEGVVKPRPAAPVPPKINICQAALKERDLAKTLALKVLSDEQARLKPELLELSRQRNEAVNNYLTAIAIATSQYNSATSSQAYTVYQQEQGQALTLYNQKIAEITAREMLLLEEQKNAQGKYDEAFASAETQYQAKIQGHNCQA